MALLWAWSCKIFNKIWQNDTKPQCSTNETAMDKAHQRTSTNLKKYEKSGGNLRNYYEEIRWNKSSNVFNTHPKSSKPAHGTCTNHFATRTTLPRVTFLNPLSALGSLDTCHKATPPFGAGNVCWSHSRYCWDSEWTSWAVVAHSTKEWSHSLSSLQTSSTSESVMIEPLKVFEPDWVSCTNMHTCDQIWSDMIRIDQMTSDYDGCLALSWDILQNDIKWLQSTLSADVCWGEGLNMSPSNIAGDSWNAGLSRVISKAGHIWTKWDKVGVARFDIGAST